MQTLGKESSEDNLPPSGVWDTDNHEVSCCFTGIREHILIWTCQYSLRHVSGIYVRNLTPFPQRDRVASALQHRTPVNVQRDVTHTADDLDLLSRKRTRRVSSASVATLRSLRSENANPEAMDLVAEDEILRPHRSPRVRPSLKQSVSHQQPASATARARSASNASSRPLHTASKLASIPLNGIATSSQRDLEKVIESRLLETFIAISIHKEEESGATPGAQLASVPMTPTPSQKESTRLSTHQRSVSLTPRGASPSPSRTSRSQLGRSSAISPSTSVHFPSSSTKGKVPSIAPQPTISRTEEPVFLSTFHRPSTNPSWISLTPEDDFAEGVDLSTSHIHVALWGHSPISVFDTPIRSSLKGKERAQDLHAPTWKVLLEWDIHLDQLEPFAPDVSQCI